MIHTPQLHCVSVNRFTELQRRTFTTPLSQVYTQWLTLISYWHVGT